MKKLLPVCLLLLLFSDVAFGQTKEIDSLKQKLKSSEIGDTTRINTYIALAKKYMSIDLDTFNLYNHTALKLSLKNKEHRLARIYSNTGLGYIYASQIDSARYVFDKALDILDRKDDKKVRAAVYSNYGMSYQSSDDLEKRIAYNLKVIDLLADNPHNLSLAHYNQGIIYGQADLFELSKKHLKIAYAKGKDGINQRSEGLALMGLGHIFMVEKKLDSAKLYLQKGLVLCEETKNPQICYAINDKLGLLYTELGQYNKATPFFLEAKDYANVRKDDRDFASSFVNLGYNELKRKNYQKSIEYFKDYERFYNKTNGSVMLDVNAYRFWSEAEANAGNLAESNKLLRKYTDVKDSLFSEKNRNLLVEAETKYQTEKKDKEIAEQKLAITESKSRTRTMTILIVSLLLGSILLWFSFSQRQKRMQQQLVSIEREQEVRTLESLMEGEEKERLRIAKELHDGVNGDLSAIKFKLVSLLETNNTVINEAVTMIDNSCEQVRTISHNLVPPSLRDFDLLEAVETYCNDMNAIHKPEITFQHVGDAIVLDKKQEANVFRIIQELVTNSIKHAEAKEILVQLSNVEGNLQFTVEDDGNGFDVENTKSDGIGMQNVRSRVAYLDGILDIKSDTKGSSFTISLNDQTKNT